VGGGIEGVARVKNVARPMDVVAKVSSLALLISGLLGFLLLYNCWGVGDRIDDVEDDWTSL